MWRNIYPPRTVEISSHFSSNSFYLCASLSWYKRVCLCLLVLDLMDSGDTDVCLCCCLSIRLSDLLSVNVGLFDQYFRVVGQQMQFSVSPVFHAKLCVVLSSWPPLCFCVQVGHLITLCAAWVGTVMGPVFFFRSWCQLWVCSSSCPLQNHQIRTFTLSSPTQTQVTVQRHNTTHYTCITHSGKVRKIKSAVKGSWKQCIHQ